jgi:hypothetical protein
MEEGVFCPSHLCTPSFKHTANRHEIFSISFFG